VADGLRDWLEGIWLEENCSLAEEVGSMTRGELGVGIADLLGENRLGLAEVLGNWQMDLGTG
jgi:hypothetical protein